MAILRVHVVPNAKSDCVVGEHGGAIKIKLRAPPVEGNANAALVRFFAAQINFLGMQSCCNLVRDRVTNCFASMA